MSGLAEAATTSGGVLVRAETAAEVGGGEVQRSEGQLTSSDDFAVWVDARLQIAAGESAKYVDLRYSRQAAQLDNYGSWVYVDSINSWAWQPTVGGSWQPYQAGRWYWTPTGYAWISYEPWGWLPYHYGSWNFSVGFGWVWSYGKLLGAGVGELDVVARVRRVVPLRLLQQLVLELVPRVSRPLPSIQTRVPGWRGRQCQSAATT